MARLTDTLEQLERDLAKYPGSDANTLLNRRLVLRKTLESYGQERYGEGHHDGMRDALNAQRAAREAADKAADGGDG